MIFSGRFSSAFVLTLILVVGCSASAPTGPDPASEKAIDPFEMNERLGRGVNFGNALEAPNEGEWGVRLEALHFQRAAEAGFETIRLPVRWNAHALPNEPYTINSRFFERVDWAISQALANDLNIIVNVHHYGGMDANPTAHRDRWLEIWRQIAERYHDQPQHVVFELLNEPHDQLTAPLWNTYVQDALDVIRESNPTRNVIVGPVSWNSINALPGLKLPDDDHLIATVHFYEPFRFTHQGASWTSGSDAWRGTEWTGSDSEKAFVTELLEKAAAWGDENGRPIFLGEFGAYQAADMDSRARWTRHVAREAERLEMSWAYWEFMAGFGLYIRDNDTFRDPLKNALIPPGEGEE